jgi:hypothetical protein
MSKARGAPAEVVSLRLTLSERNQLEHMRLTGGYRSRAKLLQFLIRQLLRDEAAPEQQTEQHKRGKHGR